MKLTVYKQTGSQATDITSSTTISTQTVNGAQVSVVTYTLQDGGFGDEDATANSTIADPVFVTFAGTPADVSGGTPGNSKHRLLYRWQNPPCRHRSWYCGSCECRSAAPRQESHDRQRTISNLRRYSVDSARAPTKLVTQKYED